MPKTDTFASSRAALADARLGGNAQGAALSAFAPFTDPRRYVAELGDSAPFALLPVRLETRFSATGLNGTAGPQLWVRIYPDDCWVDTFEPMLSDAELANAKIYWQNFWRAGGVEADERAAWRGLVTAYGSGRAGYIVDTYQPMNASAAPTKAQPTDVILVIPTQTALDAADAAAITAYWQAVWLADGDASKAQAAADALQASVGAARAATLTSDYAPVNLADRPASPLTKADVTLATAFVIFPTDPLTKPAAWTQAPRIDLFPERFVILGYSGSALTLQAIGNVITLPLYVGPDPSVDLTTDPDAAIHPDGDDLFVPDQLKWMTDFPQAVAAGMGLAIDLTAEQARTGFTRLLAIGVVLEATAAEGGDALEQLLRHHAQGRSGCAILKQGTPAHNSTGTGSGYTVGDDPDESFDDRKAAPLFTPTADPDQKRDGEWLADTLGIGKSFAATLHGADGTDQIEGRAMRRALWPATIGYWMDKLLQPIFSDQTIAETRQYFTDHVSGRGNAPAIRIGKQPYGVLPTTAFSRIAWVRDAGPRQPEMAFLFGLRSMLVQVDQEWTNLAADVAYVGKPGDAHQLLLDIIGLHPSSVEYYSRTAESLAEMFNVANIWGLGPDLFSTLLALVLNAAASTLLRQYGYTGAQTPDILNHYFFKPAEKLSAVVDDRPLSETDPIRAYTAAGKNYIEWLIDAANTSLDSLNAEAGFLNNASPATLLYLYLRHALLLGYYDTGYLLYKDAGFLTSAQLQAMKPEPVFVHVADGLAGSESRFAPLVTAESRITGSPTSLVSDYITSNLFFLAQSAGLRDQLDALSALAKAPTARLERAFSETIDLCSYRYDAWLLGLVDVQLRAMRSRPARDGDSSAGVYLGAYCWVENLQPSPAALEPVDPPAVVHDGLRGADPIRHDPTNGGYIHAPSLTHARTAAVLRSGYLANATAANPDTLSVNLSSDRVRLALSMLEGVRGGQSIGALLGYRFERGLHDDYGLVEVDKFIYPLRKAFPLVADNLAPTQTPPGVPIEAIEARNVMDGRKLADYLTANPGATYPFGDATLPAATPAEAEAINAQAGLLLDVYDAIADLALAEGVHQAVQGNFDRIGATLDAYTNGNFPPDPQVVQTGPTGIPLTHRVAAQFVAGLAAAAGATPRAQAEPALDAWAGTILPPLTDVGCVVTWTDPSGTGQRFEITLADLGLSALDVLALAKTDSAQSMTELDDRIVRAVHLGVAPRPDIKLTIGYMSAPAGNLSVFEVMALIRALRALLAASRPLRATDVNLPNAAASSDDADVFVDPARITGPKAALDSLGGDIDAFLAPLLPLVADPTANGAALLAVVDDAVDNAVALLERAARFAIPLSGWGFAYAWRQSAAVALLAQVDDLVARWQVKLAAFDDQIAVYDTMPPGTADESRWNALRGAEAQISTTAEPAATPAALRTALDATRAGFVARRNEFSGVVPMAATGFLPLLDAVQALLPVTQWDPLPLDLQKITDGAVAFVVDLAATVASIRAAITTRSAAVQGHLDNQAAAATAAAKVDELTAAAKALLGDDFILVPEFGLPTAQAQEWANAVDSSNAGALTDWLKTTGHVDFPVEEWLTGAARVRPAMRAWEAITALTAALGQPEPELLPIQLPFDATAPWLALQFDPDYQITGDRLLYTAQYSAPFDKTARQCGLLFDEWTEVIPVSDRDTGIAFNFHRPDNEPPQTILVVTPASASGRWQWDDLVAALNETLDLAKKRAVEPTQLDGTPYAPLLPATTMAVTLYAISIGTSLAAANGALSHLEEAYHA